MRFSSGVNKYLQVKERIALLNPNVKLVVVSKRQSLMAMQEVYQAGCRTFGENRVQEALSKKHSLPLDIEWHFIGSLQTHHLSKIIGYFSLIHSIDTPSLARAIHERSAKQGIVTPILLQANTSGEPSKHGLSPSDWKKAFLSLLSFSGIEVQGLMTMAPLTEDRSLIRHTFASLQLLKQELEQLGGRSLPHLSMGMSNDYEIAIEEGATIVRMGSAIF